MGKYLLKVIITNVRAAAPGTFGAEWEASLRDAVAQVGGRVEAIYFAFGDTDIYMVADVPDEDSVAALSLGISGGGDAKVRTVVLFDPSRIGGPVYTWRPPGT